MTAISLTLEQARQIAVGAQLLTSDRPADFLSMVSHLTFLQLDPTAAVAPSADLIAWSRMGNAYQPEMLTAAVEVERTLFEEVGQDDPKSPCGGQSSPDVRPGPVPRRDGARAPLPRQQSMARRERRLRA